MARFHGEIERWQEEAFRLVVTTENANCYGTQKGQELLQQWLLQQLQWQVQRLGWLLLLPLQLLPRYAPMLPPALQLQLQPPLQLQLEPLQLEHSSSFLHSLDATLSDPDVQRLLKSMGLQRQQGRLDQTLT